LLIAASGLVLLVLAPGCGDDDDDDGGGGDDGGASTVAVTLKEFEVLPDKDSVPAGSVTFTATNSGPDDPHELVVMKTDLAPGALPTADDGSVDEEGEGVELIGEIEDLAVDATEEITFTLDAGKYVLLCNIVEEEDGETESHYQQGMRAAFTVE
jgi:uncharacterized cupredoxin-like copper-binding protein